MTEKKEKKRRYQYEKLMLTVKDELGVKHDFVIDADTLNAMQIKFSAAGANFMQLLIDNAQQKKIIITQ
jgi:hypothetical protein